MILRSQHARSHAFMGVSKTILKAARLIDFNESLADKKHRVSDIMNEEHLLTCLLAGYLPSDVLFGAANPLLRDLLALLRLSLTLLHLSLLTLRHLLLLLLSIHLVTTKISQIEKSKKSQHKSTTRVKKLRAKIKSVEKMYVIYSND